MLKRILQRFRLGRERVNREATDLMTFLGDHAYEEARTRAREARGRDDRAGDRLWSKVAVKIADQTDYIIGEKVQDRYAAAEPDAARTPQRRRKISECLVEIAATIADVARGRENATTLHNAEAAVHRAAALGSAPAEAEGRNLCSALRELASARAENAIALAAGMYPSHAESAGRALERFRAVVLGPGSA